LKQQQPACNDDKNKKNDVRSLDVIIVVLHSAHKKPSRFLTRNSGPKNISEFETYITVYEVDGDRKNKDHHPWNAAGFRPTSQDV
jgi:hypothetical protein